MITFLSVILFSIFYVLGGQGNKWMKRFIAPGILGAGIVLTLLLRSFSWISAAGAVLYLPLMNIFSYGENFTQNKLIKKIIFRGLCGLMPGICGALVGFGAGHLILGITQCVIAVSGSIFFGAFNPFPAYHNDRYYGNIATMLEDVCIALSYSAIVPFMVR